MRDSRPASPGGRYTHGERADLPYHTGMDVRTYAAIEILAGFAAAQSGLTGCDVRHMAKDAVVLADALMEELEQ